jgi:cell division protein FtsQ
MPTSAPPQATAPSPARPSAAATTARKSTTAATTSTTTAASADEHLTEPILLDRGALRGAAADAPTPTAGGDDGDRDRDDRRGTGSRLRQAVRARRRYERQEARRFTQWSRRRRIGWITGLGIAVGLVVVVLLAAYSPLLSVRTIEVTGTSRLDPATVQAAVSDQLGRPLALVDEGAIREELAQFPLIKSFAIEALPPSGLGIRIVERTPVAQVQTAAGWDVVDPAGVVVQSSAEQVAGYPVYDLAGTQLGGAAFVAAGSALAALPADLLGQVASVTAATPDSVTFTFGGAGQRVVWGSAEQSTLKTLILQRLIATQDPGRAVEYDVSSPDSPVIRG